MLPLHKSGLNVPHTGLEPVVADWKSAVLTINTNEEWSIWESNPGPTKVLREGLLSRRYHHAPYTASIRSRYVISQVKRSGTLSGSLSAPAACLASRQALEHVTRVIGPMKGW